MRRALYEAPENVATLIRVISTRLFNLVSDHTFPTPPPAASVTSFASSFIKSSTGMMQDRNATKEVLNCLRVLQRVLPVVFELESDSSRLEMEVFWRREAAKDDAPVSEESSKPQFVIEDDDDEGEEPSPTPAATAGPSRPPSTFQTGKTLPSMAERLFSCLIDLLFCCGFTLPTKLQVDHYKINYTIWFGLCCFRHCKSLISNLYREKGVGSTTDPGSSQTLENNRTEVLRTLLVLFSKQIYAPPSALFISPSLYTLHFVQHIPRRDVLTILCSLLNTAMNAARPANNNLIGGVAGKLPYNHLVFKGEDPKTSLVGMCLQVLCVLLDFQSGSARDVTSADGESSAPTARTNAFRYFVMKLVRLSLSLIG